MFLNFLKRVNRNFWHFAIDKLQLIPDHVPLISDGIKRADIYTRPLWKLIFAITDALRNLLRNATPIFTLTPDYAIIKEKVVSFGDVLVRLDRDTTNRDQNLKEAKELI